LIETLLPQAEEFGVEICVSDNCSIDNTQDFMSNVVRKYANVSYSRNDTNIGIDLNIIKSMEMAKGKYLLPIGDDEMLPDGSIKTIVERLRASPELDILYFDGWFTDENLNMTRRLPPLSLQEENFIDPQTTLKKLHARKNLGTFLVNKRCLDSNWSEKYIGTYHAYWGMLWDYLLSQYKINKCCSIGYIYQPVVLLRVIDKTWGQDFLKIMLYSVPEVISRLPSEYDNEKKEVLKTYCSQKAKIANICHYYLAYSLNNDMINLYMVHFSLRIILLSRIIVKIPLPLVRFFMNQKFRLSKSINQLKQSF
jgi:glycosyltransferase involved in cell wall biosynthesis